MSEKCHKCQQESSMKFFIAVGKWLCAKCYKDHGKSQTAQKEWIN